MNLSAPPINPMHTSVYTDLHSVQKLRTEGNDQAIKHLAREFEAMMLNIMFKNMRAANQVFAEDSLFNSKETEFYQDMHDQQLSLSLAENKGFGLADMLYKQLRGQFNIQERPASTEPMPLEVRRANTPRVAPPAAGDKPLPKQVMAPVATQDKAGSATGAEKEQNQTSGPEMFSSPRAFVEHLLPMAEKAAQALGVNPLVLVAQAALETGWGQHMVRGRDGTQSNNLFNIKADTRWQGDKVGTDTLEYRDGIPMRERANFRGYSSLQESVQDFVHFLQNNGRYQQALSVAHDEHQFVHALQDAGYATDPNYSQKVLRVFEQLQRSSPGDGEG